ncbi:MAG: M23 family metallopeptidase [Desulfobacterota bacterium]|jgi:murein DD-endopeptidase MepM/ murein hydrolase activator NlpD|nr:M23 family metallopeptidase [Thermodesulfobacteriota bacterium]
MASKKITIVVVPEGPRKIRQIKIPRFWVFSLVFFFFAGSLSLTWVLRDYLSIKRNLPNLTSLQEENSLQKQQIDSLAGKVENINQKMAELKEFDRKVRAMVSMDPAKTGAIEHAGDPQQFVGIGGSDSSTGGLNSPSEKGHKKLVRMMYKSLDNLDNDISAQKGEKAELMRLLDRQKSILSSTPSVWPARGWVSSGFGYRISPFTSEKELHRGLDICNRKGAPVIAPADGVVVSVESDPGYGRTVIIHHGYGLNTMYAHLDKVHVKKGQAVRRHQEIAQVGDSGRTTGAHLHYEIHLNGVPVNPLRYILN